MTDQPIDLRDKLLAKIGSHTADVLTRAVEQTGTPAFIVGGYVRDLIMDRPSKDIDIVTVGSGIAFAKAVAALLGKRARVTVFKSFGTAQVRHCDLELEFVGARKESYRTDSRKPIVEDGTIEDDQRRRDLTINALSISLQKDSFGMLIDPFGGMDDIRNGIIRTPLEPDQTFSDDPLRMMRAIRFATQLGFTVPEYIVQAIARNKERIEIVSKERVATEFFKIMEAPKPSIGLLLMEQTGLLEWYLPEIVALKGAETRDGIGHKDNFAHTLLVVDQLSERSDALYLRLAALFHDVAKPVTKKYDRRVGWTFYNHNYVGARMLPRIFKRNKWVLDERLKYVQKLVNLHMRPAQLADEGVTDSAVRRLLFEAGDDIDDLMTLCEADMTSKNPVKIRRYTQNFAVVRKKLIEIEEKDRIRNFQPPVSGEEIMAYFGIGPCRMVGVIKEEIKNAILDGVIPNEHEAGLEYMRHFVQQHPEVLDPRADRR